MGIRTWFRVGQYVTYRPRRQVRTSLPPLKPGKPPRVTWEYLSRGCTVRIIRRFSRELYEAVRLCADPKCWRWSHQRDQSPRPRLVNVWVDELVPYA